MTRGRIARGGGLAALAGHIGLALVLLAMVGAGVGFLGFMRTAQTPGAEPASAEAIVALTGGANAPRLAEAGGLLARGKGARLLISGVNRATPDRDLEPLLGVEAETFACCVETGRAAVNTVGNADETRAWIRRHGLRHVIVVTDGYHMPRALLELKAANPGVLFTPYPVVVPPFSREGWWRNDAAFGLVVREYGKYLAVLARETSFDVLGRPAPPPESAA